MMPNHVIEIVGLVLAIVGKVMGQELSALLLGDWGTGTPSQRDVAAAMNNWAAQNKPQFILTMGDNFYSDGIEGKDDPRWESHWNQMYTGDHIRNLTWEVSLGNHGYRPSGSRNEWNQVQYTSVDSTGRWHLPYLWHSFYRNSSLGEIHFVLIDSEGIRLGENDPEAQLQWLEMELRESRGVMKIVVAHHPVYTIGKHPPIDVILEAQVLTLMEEHGVDFYVVGHDHNMQHLKNISSRSHYLEQLVCGGGGRKLASEQPIKRRLLEARGISIEAFFETHGFAGLTVMDGELRIEYRNSNNELIYDLRKAPRTRSRSVSVKPWRDQNTIRHI